MTLVPAQGFEPWTIGLKDRCSNQAELRRPDTNLGFRRLKAHLDDGFNGRITHRWRQKYATAQSIDAVGPKGAESASTTAILRCSLPPGEGLGCPAARRAGHNSL